jgi:hypothetical protein
MFEFIIKLALIFLTNIVFSFAVIFFLYTYSTKYKYSFGLLIIIGLGLGPMLMSILLYYSFLLLPHLPSFIYLLMIITIFGVLGYIGRGNFKNIMYTLKKRLRHIWVVNRYVASSFSLIVAGLILLWLAVVSIVPIFSHDMFEHMTYGKNIGYAREIKYEKERYFAQTEFHYYGTQGYAFALQRGWEELVNSSISTNSDYFTRSISGYYLILLVILFFYIISKYDKVLAVCSVLLLLLTPAIGMGLVFYHLDTLRIFFLCCSLLQLIQLLKNDSKFNKGFLGLILGIATFIHMLNTFFAVLIVGMYFILGNKKSLMAWKTKFDSCLIIGIIVLAAGGIHYLFDTLWGLSSFNTLF